MKALIVGRHDVVPLTFEHKLERSGFTCERLTSLQNALAIAHDFSQSIIILGLKSRVGNENFLEALRQQHKSQVPVLVLTQKVENTAQLAAFEHGCDDYQQSDCHEAILYARLLALIRRSNQESQNVIEAGAIKINLTTQLVTVGGESRPITGFSYRLLTLLCLKKGHVLSRSIIIDELYHSSDAVRDRTIDKRMHRLRSLLGNNKYIESVRGDGYRIKS